MAEPAWSNVKLHVNAEQVPPIDLSSVGRTLTLVGNANRSTLQAKFGSASLAFDGTNDSIDCASSSDFNLSTAAWTMRLHLRLSSLNQGSVVQIYLSANDYVRVVFNNASGKLLFWIRTGGVTRISSSGTSGLLSLNTWYHIAISHGSGTTKFFVDGTEVLSQAATYTSGNYAIRFGEDISNIEDLQGYIDEVQFCTEQVYTTSFTAPTAPYAYNVTLTATALALTNSFGTGQLNVGLYATGLALSPSFGTGQLVYNQTGQATGLQLTPTFGTAQAIYSVFLDATGLQLSPTFGTALIPESIREQRVSVRPVRIGQPVGPVDGDGRALSVRPVRFGYHTAFKYKT